VWGNCFLDFPFDVVDFCFRKFLLDIPFMVPIKGIWLQLIIIEAILVIVRIYLACFCSGP
jgi:hypothetical protein